jgi:hypothetical protein
MYNGPNITPRHRWEGGENREGIAHMQRQPSPCLNTVKRKIITFRLQKQHVRVKACACIGSVLQILWLTKCSVVVYKPMYQNTGDCVKIKK